MGCSASKGLEVIKVTETIEDLPEAVDSKGPENADPKSNAGDKKEDTSKDDS